jgi:ribonuclease R
LTQKKTYHGIFKGHRVGYGFVKSLNGEYSPDIFIPKTATSNAVEGDLVEVLITSTESKKGWEGKVLKIVERKHQDLGAIVVEAFSKRAYVLCPLLGLSKEIEVALKGSVQLRIGDRITVRLHKWKNGQKKLSADFSSYIGNIDDPICDIEAGIKDFALRNSFSNEVLAEVKKFPKEIDPSAYPDREDLRKLECLTIDPDTAKDFDDAISIEKSKKGFWVLGVHIADVSFFVQENSHLDREASLRCNSTYLPGTCIPMLPGELSDHLCSLKPNVPRLAVSTFMTFDSEGELQNYRITRSIIESRQRLTYNQALSILEKKTKSPLYTSIKKLEELALILKKVRKTRGCLDLALSDSRIVIDKNGVPTGIEVDEYDITHQMIEEFMLKNNEVIAKHLSEKELKIPFRIHEPPKPDSLEDFVQIVSTYGFKISSPPTQEELQNLFEEVKGSELEHQVSIAFIKCMKLASYCPENQGHYGLKLEYYCHFTSPIRRYVDLVVHRTLFEHSQNVDFKEISERCSDAERLSAKAETSVRTLKILRYLLILKSKKIKSFHAVISKVKPFGFFFELPEFLLEGFIHISKIGSDFYDFDENKKSIIGGSTREIFSVGHKIKVSLESVCLITQEAEWRRIS